MECRISCELTPSDGGIPGEEMSLSFHAGAIAFGLIFSNISSAMPMMVIPSENQNPVMRVMIIDEDDRRTEEQVAKEQSIPLSDVRKRYAATGKIDCDGVSSSANLIDRDDLVVGVAHTFMNRKTCQMHRPFSQCQFVLSIDGVEERHSIAEMIAIGPQCPAPLNSNDPYPLNDDFAIFRLRHPVTRVQPYKVGSPGLLKNGLSVTFAAALALDFFDPLIRPRTWPKIIGRCKIRTLNLSAATPTHLSTDCDAAKGSSGGALLLDRDGAPPILLGVLSTTNENNELLEMGMRALSPNRCAYSDGNCASYFAPVDGRFLEALRRAGIAVNVEGHVNSEDGK